MTPYRENAPCVKCGHPYHDVTYTRAGEWATQLDGPREWLKVTCKRCGFSYFAATVEAKEPA